MPTPNPRLDRRVRRDGIQSITSQESTLTPVEHPFTTMQARSQIMPFQEPTVTKETNPLTKETTLPAELEDES